MTKKFLSIGLVLVLIVSLITGCVSEPTDSSTLPSVSTITSDTQDIESSGQTSDSTEPSNSTSNLTNVSDETLAIDESEDTSTNTSTSDTSNNTSSNDTSNSTSSDNTSSNDTSAGPSNNDTSNDTSIDKPTESTKPNFSLDSLNHTLFDGKNAFIIINDNIPFFTKSDITVNSFEIYGELDDLGRCTVAFACVGRDLMPTEARGDISSVFPSGWKYNGKSNNNKYDFVSGKYIYNRCHLIGFQLTGENANKQNLITGTRFLNIDGMLSFENMVADAVKEDNLHVLYRVTPVYEGNNLVAEGVLLEGYSVEDNGETIEFCVFSFNVQPGVEINYATGENCEANKTPGNNEADKQTTEDTSNQTEVSESTQETSIPEDTQVVLVWITKSGKKYHSKSNCGSMKEPYQIELSEAIFIGLEPCKNCYK